jgi:hypothetical protein
VWGEGKRLGLSSFEESRCPNDLSRTGGRVRHGAPQIACKVDRPEMMTFALHCIGPVDRTTTTTRPGTCCSSDSAPFLSRGRGKFLTSPARYLSDAPTAAAGRYHRHARLIDRSKKNWTALLRRLLLAHLRRCLPSFMCKRAYSMTVDRSIWIFHFKEIVDSVTAESLPPPPPLSSTSSRPPTDPTPTYYARRWSTPVSSSKPAASIVVLDAAEAANAFAFIQGGRAVAGSSDLGPGGPLFRRHSIRAEEAVGHD